MFYMSARWNYPAWASAGRSAMCTLYLAFVDGISFTACILILVWKNGQIHSIHFSVEAHVMA